MNVGVQKSSEKHVSLSVTIHFSSLLYIKSLVLKGWVELPLTKTGLDS